MLIVGKTNPASRARNNPKPQFPNMKTLNTPTMIRIRLWMLALFSLLSCGALSEEAHAAIKKVSLNDTDRDWTPLKKFFEKYPGYDQRCIDMYNLLIGQRNSGIYPFFLPWNEEFFAIDSDTDEIVFLSPEYTRMERLTTIADLKAKGMVRHAQLTQIGKLKREFTLTADKTQPHLVRDEGQGAPNLWPKEEKTDEITRWWNAKSGEDKQMFFAYCISALIIVCTFVFIIGTKIDRESKRRAEIQNQKHAERQRELNQERLREPVYQPETPASRGIEPKPVLSSSQPSSSSDDYLYDGYYTLGDDARQEHGLGHDMGYDPENP